MQHERRRIVCALGSLSLLGGFSVPALGQLKAGADYSELKVAQPVEVPAGKIEVVEFFWYGCPHCYSLEPFIENWSKKLAADTVFRRIPAVFNERWARDAAIYYAFETLGVTEKVHRPIFDAIHKEALKTDSPPALAQWLERHGVDGKKFEDVVKSFGVQSKVKRAQQLSVAYRLEGTPTMGVNGRFTVSPEQGKTQEGILANVDYLIAVARQGVKK